MHFTASIGPATRATTDGSWKGNEYLQVQIVDNYTSGTPQWSDGTQQTYTVTVGGVMTKIDGTDAFWQANGEVKAIRAWYDADNSSATTLSDDHSVKTDQSGDGYTQSDFLFAQRKAEFTELREKDIDMTFYHQVAKVKVNILKGDETPTDLSSVTGLTIGGIATSGTFTAPALGGTTTTPLGTWNATGEKQNITPHAVTATGDNTLASYEALVIPQTVVGGNTRLFTIAATGYSDFVYTPTEAITWQSGMEYTYNITIKGSELEVSTSQSIGWNTGSTGSGSVTLPTEIDLSQATGTITIEDDNTYLLTGSGSYPVTIKGNATVILQNVSLNTSTGNAISVESDNPTIYVKGNNAVTSSSGAGIYVAEGSTVTITGDSRSDVLTATGGAGSAGIGSYSTSDGTNYSCGNITISNVTLTARSEGYVGAGDFAAGIGSAGVGTVGSISISDATIYAQVYGDNINRGAAAIGGGIDGMSRNIQTAFDITISNSTIHATRGCPHASYIGAGGLYGVYSAGYNIISTARITDSHVYDESGKEITQ